jgi:hypothetical protein
MGEDVNKNTKRKYNIVMFVVSTVEGVTAQILINIYSTSKWGFKVTARNEIQFAVTEPIRLQNLKCWFPSLSF